MNYIRMNFVFNIFGWKNLQTGEQVKFDFEGLKNALK
jgi:hypothetical protein